MLGASVYITLCSAKNRARQRLARLREPRYLLGAMAGVLYLVFVLGRAGGSRRRGARRATAGMLPVASASAPVLVGVPLLGLAAIGWLVPLDSGLLDFSKAETHLLFPAPVPRWQLLLHRLLRSQLGLLFAAVVPSFFLPFASSFSRVRWAIALWLLLVTGKLYFAGVSLTRTRIRDGGWAAAGAAAVPFALVAGAAVAAGTAIARALSGVPMTDWQEVVARVERAVTTGAVSYLLWPFTALARPFFAASPLDLAEALPAAFLVLFTTLIWVLRSDDALQEAAAEVAGRRERAAEARAGYRAARAAWALPLRGRPEGAFLWKAATQMIRSLNVPALFWLLVPLGGVILAGAFGGEAAQQVATMAGGLAAFGSGGVIVLGPQALRIDLRQDLQHLDVLKTWPVRAAAVVRGELLAPGLALTLGAWTLAGLALLLSATTFPGWAWSSRTLAAGVAAILAPTLIFAQYVVHAAAVLVFPAWVPVGGQRARGVEAMGQRLVLMAGTLVAMAVMLLPGALAAGLVWLTLGLFAGRLAILAGALAFSIVVALEVLAATEALGPLFEKLDLTGIERPD